jgi:glycosyltransferase involved in cell wall biosynthesis
MADRRAVVMFGPSLTYPGGMTEVVRRYAAQGFFEAWPVRYVSTYTGRGIFTQLRSWLPALCTLLLLLVQRRVALVHVHSAAYGSFWRKAALCALASAFRVPYLFHLHDGRFPAFYERGCNGFTKSCVRAVLRKAARVVVLTRRWCEEVRNIEPAAKVVIIGNPVAVSTFVPSQRPARSVLFLGWLHRDKGVLDLLHAMPEVLRSVPDATFVLAGSGDVDTVMSLARSLGVEQAVRLPGWVDGAEKSNLLREADVFVLPSYYEGLPLGVLEAMACGVPVVATAVGGIPDVIDDRTNGLLVDPGEPEGLARAIVAMLTDDALRARLRSAAHRDVRKRFSPENVIADLESLYRELGIEVHLVKPRTCAAS